MSRVLILLGAALVLIGLVLHFIPGVFSWFGRLPGDVAIERKGSGVYIPWVSMLIISIVLSVVLSLVSRFFPPR